MRSLVLLVVLSTVACTGALQGGTIGPTSSQPTVIQYAINVPTAADRDAIVAQYSSNVALAPMDAQQKFDFTNTYGRPNVYYGETAPPPGVYQGVGIVVAPKAAALKLFYTHADWPAICPSACSWQGHPEIVPVR